MRPRLLVACLASVALGAVTLSACSPVYVVRAGIAEAKILKNRQPLADIVLDPATNDDTRGKLTFAMEAREFAADELGFEVGRIYTSFSQLDSDTLVMVLSAAHRDRFQAKTWWFPVVGHVPYRGFFNHDQARREQQKLEDEGFDTYLRPAAAFSTLGWFNDPILSSMLRYDDVGIVETVLHEFAHVHLFIPGHVTFNESFGSFVGGVGAVEFFCGRDGGGPDTVKCRRAEQRWADQVRFSRFMDEVVECTQALLARDDLSEEEKLAARTELFAELQQRFRDEVQPEVQPGAFRSFLTMPLNNATLLSRMRYYHRLEDFEALRQAHGGSLRATVEAIGREAEKLDDPFAMLPRAGLAADEAADQAADEAAGQAMGLAG